MCVYVVSIIESLAIFSVFLQLFQKRRHNSKFIPVELSVYSFNHRFISCALVLAIPIFRENCTCVLCENNKLFN